MRFDLVASTSYEFRRDASNTDDVPIKAVVG